MGCSPFACSSIHVHCLCHAGAYQHRQTDRQSIRQTESLTNRQTEKTAGQTYATAAVTDRKMQAELLNRAGDLEVSHLACQTCFDVKTFCFFQALGLLKVGSNALIKRR